MKWLSLAATASFATLACDDPPEVASGTQSTQPVFMQYDQILAEVRATPVAEKGVYMISVRNYGHGPITFWREVKQQWRHKEHAMNLATGWHEETNPGHAVGTYDLHPEQEFQMTAIPVAKAGVILRFGVGFLCQEKDDYRKLVIWSRPVNPEFARWNRKAEQGEDADAAKAIK